MSKREIEKCFRHWQKRLGLLHWTIEVYVVEAIPDGDLGFVNFHEEQLWAKVLLLPDTTPGIIVHELLHLLINPLGSSQVQSHQVIACLTKALTGEVPC